MAKPNSSPRNDQRLRTRKDLLQAASRLLQERPQFTLEEVAREAMVSRATAYRYFPTLEALLVEAPLDGAVPDAERFFSGDRSVDPVERLDRAEAALHHAVYKNEAQLRALVAHSLKRRLDDGKDRLPVRQNRRVPLIEAALAPARDRLDEASYARLCSALALVFGTESMLVFRDVAPLSENDARRVKSWVIDALVRRALADSSKHAPRSARRTRERAGPKQISLATPTGAKSRGVPSNGSPPRQRR